jgi:hypothetical protein
VLKVGVSQEELWREIAALLVYDGDGACRVLQPDAPAVVLDEWVHGGPPHAWVLDNFPS